MNAIPYNCLFLIKNFYGNYDVIKDCGLVVADNLSEMDAYTAADQVAV